MAQFVWFLFGCSYNVFIHVFYFMHAVQGTSLPLSGVGCKFPGSRTLATFQVLGLVIRLTVFCCQQMVWAPKDQVNTYTFLVSMLAHKYTKSYLESVWYLATVCLQNYHTGVTTSAWWLSQQSACICGSNRWTGIHQVPVAA